MTINKPNSRSRLWRATRRKRYVYPAVIERGKKYDLERPECGRNVAIQTRDADGKPLRRRVTNGSFVFERESL